MFKLPLRLVVSSNIINSTTPVLPANPNPPSHVVEAALPLPAPQFPEGGAGGHLHHGAALRVGHEEPPHLVVAGDDVSPHLKTSEVNPVPECCFGWNDDVVEYLTRVRFSHCSIRIIGIIIFLQGIKFLESLISAQMFPEVNAGK